MRLSARELHNNKNDPPFHESAPNPHHHTVRPRRPRSPPHRHAYRGECIPIRLFMSSLDLTPTYKSVNNKFSVKYYLNLVLVDQEDRRYFKQQEVTLWRKDIG